MATAEQAWMPPAGRHPVNVGGSLARSLKARKGLPAKPNKNLPISDFYLFRYGFKPESVDSTKPGTVEVTQGKDATTVRMERGSHLPDEVHVFKGKAEPAREVECVLIYNEEDGMFTLEKLDSSLTLSHEGRAQPKTRPPSVSPLPTPSPAPSLSKAEQDDLQAELDRELLTTLIDTEGDIDDEFEEILPDSLATGRRKSRAEEEVIDMPPPRAQPQQAKPKPGLKLKGKSAATGSTAKSAVVGEKGKGKGKGKWEQNQVEADVEEEDLEFGQPAKQAKRSRLLAPPKNELALPSASTATRLPTGPPTLQSVAPRPSELLVPPPPLPPQSETMYSESEDELVEVTQLPTVAATDGGGDGSIFGDEEVGEEIDLNQFAAQMDMELENAEDDDADVDADADAEFDAAAEVVTGRPMSLNQFAGGEPDQDDDDYSSSDDSDDD